jgi:hypothetical protein
LNERPQSIQGILSVLLLTAKLLRLDRDYAVFRDAMIF